jgi:hypothetical protein
MVQANVEGMQSAWTHLVVLDASVQRATQGCLIKNVLT